MSEVSEKEMREADQNFRNQDFSIGFNYNLVSDLACYGHDQDGKERRYIDDWEIDIMAYPMLISENEDEVTPVLAGKAKVHHVFIIKGAGEEIIANHSKNLFDVVEQLFDFEEEVYYDEDNEMGFHIDCLVIDSIVLKPDYQRIGIGTALMQEFKEKFKNVSTIAGRVRPMLFDKEDNAIDWAVISHGADPLKHLTSVEEWCVSIGMKKRSRGLYYLPIATTMNDPVETRQKYLLEKEKTDKHLAEIKKREELQRLNDIKKEERKNKKEKKEEVAR